MIYGYARCSTNESMQDVKRQTRELRAAGAEEIVYEYEHGDAEEKQAQRALMERVVEGDTIMATEVSRLTRSTQQMCALIAEAQAKRLRLMILGSITIDCRSGEIDPMSKAFVQMAAIFSELELSMIRARVKSGMANARAKGAAIGRPRMTADGIPDAFFRHYRHYQDGSITMTELARVCDISRQTAYRYIKLIEEKGGEEDARGEGKTV